MLVEASASPERNVKLLRNGHDQAVGIAREFELPGDEPALPKSLLAVLAKIRPLDEAFLPISDLLVNPIEL